MKGLNTCFPFALLLLIVCSVSLASAQPHNDFSQRNIEQKTKEAKEGKLDYKFVMILIQTAGNAFEQALENPHADGWWDSALEKYEAGLKLYETGKAEPIYIAATAIQLGAVNLHRNRYKTAERLFCKGVALLEDYKPNSNTELVKHQYVLGLGYLGRVYRLEGQTELAKKTLSKALSFAERHFGKDSIEAKVTRSHMKWIKPTD